MKTSMSYDTLVSKIVLSGSPSFEALIPRAIRALRNVRLFLSEIWSRTDESISPDSYCGS